MKPSRPVASDRACHHSPDLRHRQRRVTPRHRRRRMKTPAGPGQLSGDPGVGGCPQHLLLQHPEPISFLEAQVPSVHGLVVVECQHHAVRRACSEGGPGHPSPCRDGTGGPATPATTPATGPAAPSTALCHHRHHTTATSGL